MSWRDTLQPASFRGVAFEIDGSSARFGRRNVRHEFPQRDSLQVEDLGRAAREFTLQAFVIGDDWQARRNALIAAVEQGGPGTLIHPTYGEMRVNAELCEVAETNDEQRMARLSLSFVRSDQAVFPAVELSSSAAVTASADALDVAHAGDFAALWSVVGMPPAVAAAAIADLASCIEAGRAAVNGPGSGLIADLSLVSAALTELEVQAEALVTDPVLLYAKIAAVAEAMRGSITAMFRLAASFVDPGPPERVTVAEQAIEQNSQAFAQLVRIATLTAAARTVAETTFAVYDDAVAAQARLADSLAAEADTAADSSFAALTDLRVAVVADIDDRAADLARLRFVAVPAVRSTLELAAELYGDGSRGLEIETRNDVPHPGFLTGELAVLSE